MDGPTATRFKRKPFYTIVTGASTQHVGAPTRYRSDQVPSLLDLVITNENHFVDQVRIKAPIGHSDHCVLEFDYICYWARNPERQWLIRNFSRADFSSMGIFLDRMELGPTSVEQKYATITQKIHEADSSFVPKKTYAQPNGPEYTPENSTSSGITLTAVR